ncbi:LacI family DNA-binding transcriptional regulator [Bacillus pumilus]|uniref:LacI family DNA-binding transcriptional regulator n=1 Tax=Bacillus pumilus TaxID=1408 RepID=UPI000B454B19|nr:LacI family DNA-binding transcriptional regulator [Bacillus pumilus]MBU8639171.1 LacI family transcriptional regulator [Bacillus pumilus]MBU8698490.1 LacI family transcriptional regulator [Bacillus pumilus]MBU8727273.1 LacI family transcriptional regulator [Bacillus pumilus]OUZ06992.1 LacI family transcriptional regulator [Bacillus pumilus]
MTNITEIAKIANVSRTTVSRVLNHHPYVKPEKRDAVLKAMKELNYVPNFNAINLSKGKTNVLGVIVPKINHPFFSKLIAGLGEECNKHNYSLLVHQTNNDLDQELDFFNRLKYKLIDGLILGSCISPPDTLDEISKFGKIVSCEASESKQVASIFINHESGIKMAIDHLRIQGHQSIGLCIGNPKSGVGISRKKSFFHFQKEYGLQWSDNWYFDEQYTIEDGIEIAKLFLNGSSRPTAMVVGSDYVAAGIIYEAKKQGLRIPEDLAVLGFDNQPISKIIELSTIHQPIKELGQTAANLLYNLINNKEVPNINKLELQFIKRKST